MKRCWWCKRFKLSLGQPHFSEFTPGEPGDAGCHLWEIGANDPDRDIFEEVHQAETCPEYELSDKVKP